MPSASTDDPAAASFAWRLANLVAIASPYLLGAALLLTLTLNRPPAPPPSAALTPPPPAEAPVGGPTVQTEPGSTALPPSFAAHPQPVPPATPAASAARPASSAPAVVSPGASASATAHPPPPHPAIAPVPVDSVTAGTMKLSGDAPPYPAIAQAAHIQGAVVLALTIAPDGSVEDVRALSGPTFLEAAAVTALRSWRYRQYLVAGQAVPFQTQVTIDFKLSTIPPQ